MQTNQSSIPLANISLTTKKPSSIGFIGASSSISKTRVALLSILMAIITITASPLAHAIGTYRIEIVDSGSPSTFLKAGAAVTVGNSETERADVLRIAQVNCTSTTPTGNNVFKDLQCLVSDDSPAEFFENKCLVITRAREFPSDPFLRISDLFAVGIEDNCHDAFDQARVTCPGPNCFDTVLIDGSNDFLLDGTATICRPKFHHDSSDGRIFNNNVRGSRVNCTENRVPDRPEDLKATASATAVAIGLEWAPPPSDGGSKITSYRIERAVGAGGSFNAIIPDPALDLTGSPITYIDTGVDLNPMGLSPDTTYRYRVRARNDRGLSLLPSNIGTATTPIVAPGMPTMLKATASTTAVAIELSWVAPMHADGTPNDGGSMITGYRIERAEGEADFSDLVANTGAATSYIDDGSIAGFSFASGIEYRYRVRAINAVAPTGGAASKIAMATAVPAPPDAPTELKTTADTTLVRIVLSWDEPDDRGSKITGYRIERREEKTGFSDLVANTGTTTTSYIDDGSIAGFSFASGIEYRYRVRAINAVDPDGGDASDVAMATALPVAPMGLMLMTGVRGSQTEVQLDWKLTNTGGADVTYTLKRSSSSVTSVTVLGTGTSVTVLGDPKRTDVPIPIIVVSGTTTTSFADTRLRPSTTYYYQITATNSKGSVVSNIASLALGALEKPSAPRDLMFLERTDNSVTLTWKAPTSNTSTSSDPTLTQYHIERAVGTGGFQQKRISVEGLADSENPEYTDTRSLAPNTRYLYRVRARNSPRLNIFNDSDYSNVITLPRPPAAPTLMVVTGSTTTDSIKLTWNTPDANDGPLSGYRIQRAEKDGGFVDLDPDPELDENQNSYTDMGLGAGTPYRYQIYAFNRGDGLTVPSAVSTPTAPETTSVAPEAPAAPRDLRATTTGTNSITLRWLTPNDNGGTLASYSIERRQEGLVGATFESVTGDAPVLASALTNQVIMEGTPVSYTDPDPDPNDPKATPLMPGTTYTYRVRAINTFDAIDPATGMNFNFTVESAPSRVTETTLFAPPGAPRNLMAPEADRTANSITLTWNTPENDGGGITGYLIERAVDSSIVFNFIMPTPILDLTGSPITYTDTGVDLNPMGLDPNTKYNYQVRATNSAAPNGDRDIFPELKAYTLPAPPATPTGLTASNIGTSSITLTWNALAADQTNGGNLESYSIMRTGGTTNFEPVLVAHTARTMKFTHTDTGLAPGTEYKYQVSAINRGEATDPATGMGFTAESELSMPPVPATTLAAASMPRNFMAPEADRTANSVTLIWNVPASDGGGNIISYRIQRAVGADGVFNAITPASTIDLTGSPITYTDTGVDLNPMGLEPNRLYRYRVSAINDNVGVGAFSPELEATTLPLAPDAPENLEVTPGSITRSSITLTWQAPNANGGPLTRYSIMRTGGTTAFVPVLVEHSTGTTGGGVTTFSRQLTGLDPNTEYTYEVRAINENIAGGTAMSSPSTLTKFTLPALPDAPGTPTVTGSTATSITLEWDAVVLPGGKKVAGYRIQRRVMGDMKFPVLVSDTGLTTTHEDMDGDGVEPVDMDGLEPGITYQYRVRAIDRNASGETLGVRSGILTATTLPAPPGTPTTLTATDTGTSSVTLSWTPPTTSTGDPDPTITGYEVLRTGGPGEVPSTSDTGLIPIGTTTVASYTDPKPGDTALSPNVSYNYFVRALNATGRSESSTFLTVTTQPVAPAVPTGLRVTGSTTNSITLSWAALPLDSNGGPLTNYRLERAVGAADFTLLKDTGTSTTHTDMDGLSFGNTYRYRVRATNANASGSAHSDFSDPPITATTLPPPPVTPTAPGTPTTLTALDMTQVFTRALSIQLSWAAPVNADGTPNDGGSMITGYEIERSVGGGAVTRLTPTGTATSYTDNSDTLRGGTTYSYQVFARNVIGLSAPSKTGTVTTPAVVPAAPGTPTVVGSVGTSSVTFNWSPPDDGGSNIISYRIERAVGAEGATGSTNFAELHEIVVDPVVTTITYTDPSFGDTLLKPSTLYRYRVNAINAVEKAIGGLFSGIAEATTLAVPGIPTNLKVTGSTTSSITLSWTPPTTSTGDPTITGYFIEVAGEPDLNKFESITFDRSPVPIGIGIGDVVINGGTASYTDSRLDSNASFRYRVSAVNAMGIMGGRSSELDATTLPIAPNIPVLEVDDMIAVSATSITLRWETPVANGGPLTHYRIQRAEGATPADSDFMHITSAPRIAVDDVAINVRGDFRIYTDTGLDSGIRYNYRVNAINENASGSAESGFSAIAEATTLAAPGIPTNLKVTGSTTSSITLSWTPPTTSTGDPDPTITGYFIEVAGEPDLNKFESITFDRSPVPIGIGIGDVVINGGIASYTDSRLDSNASFRYRVSAVNAMDIMGGRSSELDATTLPIAPNIPVLMVVAGSTTTDSVTLQWKTPAANGGPLSGYRIQRRVPGPGGSNFTDLNPVPALTGTSTSYTDMGLASGITYEYQMLAINKNVSGSAESGFSAIEDAMTLVAPGIPTNLRVTGSTTSSITLSWTPPTTSTGDPDPTITGYFIEVAGEPDLNKFESITFDRSPVPIGIGIGDVVINGGIASYTDSRLDSNASFRYRVSAVNAMDIMGGRSSELDATTLPIAPNIPVLMVVAGSTTTDSVTLQWKTPAANGGPLSGYRIQRRIPVPGGSNFTDLNPVPALTGTSTSYTDMGLASGITYEYQMLAINKNVSGSAESGFSAIEDATTLPIAPNIPVLMVVAGSTTTDSVTLTWKIPDANGGPLSGYRIQRRVPGPGGSNFTDLNPVPALTGTSTSYTDMGLASGITYEYQMLAINKNASGSAESGFSAIEDATTLPIAPNIPVLMVVAGSTTTDSVTLRWKIPDTNGGTLESYTIQRAEGAGAFMPVTTPNPLPVGDVALTLRGTSTIVYTDRGLSAGTAYRYQVLATNIGSADSMPSNTGTATTLPVLVPVPDAPGNLETEDIMVDSVTLTWKIPDTNGGTLESYTIQRAEGAGAFMPVTTPNPLPVGDAALTGTSTISYTDTNGLSPSTTYRYQVLATNIGSADSMPSNTGTATTLPVLVPVPDAPGSLETEDIMIDSVTLTWKIPDTNGGTLESYTIQRAEGAGAFMPVTTPNPLPVGDAALTGTSTISYTDTNGLSPSTTYRYQVLATNIGSADSMPSNTGTATTLPVLVPVPDAPGNLETEDIMVDSVTLTWKIPDTNGGTLESYTIQRAEGAGTFMPVTTPNPLPVGDAALTGTSTISYTDTNGLSPSTTYRYQVLATNIGSADSMPSNTGTATTLPVLVPVPDAPGNLETEDIMVDSVTLTWKIPDTNGGTLESYTIQRAEGAGAFMPVTTPNPLPVGDAALTGTSTISYTDTNGLSPSTTYRYQVLATNIGSADSMPSNTGTATTLPVLVPVPDAPGNLETEDIMVDSVTLTWKIPDTNGGTLESYTIQRAEGAGAFMPVTTPNPLPVGDAALTGTSTISYTDTNGLSPSTTYRYQVLATNIGSADSMPSNTGTATTLPVPVPDAPGNLAAEDIMVDSVTLTWKIPDTNGGTLESYTIQRAEGAGAFMPVTTPNPLPVGDVALTLRGTSTIVYTDRGLSAGTAYRYQVLATNMGSADSMPSNTGTATTLAAPDMPRNLTQTNTGTSTIELSWTVPADTGGSMITGYLIERAEGAGGLFNAIMPTPMLNLTGSPITYTDTGVDIDPMGLSANTSYRYRVSAINSAAPNGGDASSLTVTTLPVAPVAPTLMVVTGSTTADSIKLRWEAPEDNGGNLESYSIMRTGGMMVFGPVSVPHTVGILEFIDTSVAPGTTYRYQVSATNRGDAIDPATSMGFTATSMLSALTDPVTTLPVVPGMPMGLSATADAKLVQIALSWTAPTNNDGSLITGYRIERAEGAGGLFNAIMPTPMLDLTGSPITYTDTGVDLDPIGLAPSTLYRYRVSAINSVAPNGSVVSNIATATTAIVAPSGLTLRAIQTSATTVRLSWELASDGGEAVTYTLERSSSVTSVTVLGGAMTSVTVLADPITDITPASGTDTSFTDSGLEAGTQYYYRVTATNSRGSEMSDIERPTGGLSERAQALNESLLPMIAQTATAMTLDAISNRIDNVSSAAVANKTTFAGADSIHAIIKQLGSDFSSEQELGDMLLKWLGNSSFSHSFAGSGIAGGAGLSVWGTGDYKDLNNDDNILSWDGNVWGLSVGADVQLDTDWLLGTAVSWSSGEFDYTDRATESTGDYDYKNFGIHPYFNWAPSGAGYNIWGSVSYGQGEIEIRDQAMLRAVSSDTEQYGVAAGMNLTLSSSHSQQASHSIDLKSDVSALWIDVEGSGEDILSDTFQHQRLRLLLSAEHDYIVGVRRHLIPSIELGGRYETGRSAEDGTAIEFSGSLSYKDLLAGFMLAGQMNALFGAEYDEWGASALMRFGGGGASSRGLSFSLEPTIGRANADPTRLWEKDVSSLARNLSKDGASDLSAALVSEISYGMGMHSTFGVLATWQPYANMELGSAIRRYRLGLRYQFAQGLGFRIEGQSLRNSGASATSSNTGKDYGVQLKTEFEF